VSRFGLEGSDTALRTHPASTAGVVLLIEQRSLPTLMNKLNEPLLDYAFVQRHRSGFASLDTARLWPDPHDVKVAALFDVDAA
jgi:hypothetical protein